MRRSAVSSLLASAVLGAALAGCDQPGGGTTATPPPVGAADAGMTCPQIVAEIARQNSIIKMANAQAREGGQTGVLGNPTSQAADLGNATTGSAALVPGAQQETPGQLEADQMGNSATARAKALVELGRQKKCFL